MTTALAPAPTAVPLKLDIGAGEFPAAGFGAGDGWTTVDRYQPADVQADMGELPYGDGTVDAIVCSHALEHAPRERIPAILGEWWRVLRPGGTLLVLVPNMDWVARHWLESPADDRSLHLLFGLQRDEGDYHRTAWNAATLHRDLATAGFDVRGVEVIWSHGQETLRASCVRGAQAVEYVPPPAPPDPRMAGDKVLVACPTYAGMEYCLDEYLARYDALAWPNRGLMLVDNTRDGGAWAESIRHKVETGDPRRHLRRVGPSPDFEETFHRAWRVILDHADMNGYDWVFSLEADVMVPALALDALLNVAGYAQAPFVSHLYPFHHGRQGVYEGLGCVLIATKLLRTALDVTHKQVPYTEAAIYDAAARVSRMTLRDLFPIEHRDAPPGAKPWQYDRTDDAVAVMIEPV